MLSRPARRLLSTKVSRPLQPVTKTESKTNSAAAQQDAGAKVNDRSDANPWSHFAAFSSMDDYVDVTLIQYGNDEKTNKDDKEE